MITSSRILHLLDLSWPEVEELDKQRSCVLLPLSPIEEHGPHLPLGTDIFGARDIAELAAKKCIQANSSMQVVHAPVIPLGCADITSDFPGTISLRGKTLYNLLVDFCSGLARSGFKYIVIVNHHLDSVHLKAILAAIDTIEKRYSTRILETAGRILYSGMKLEEIEQGEKLGLPMKTEVHADIRETSYIVYKYPHLVKKLPEDLPDVRIDVGAGLAGGHKTFKDMGADQGYIGSPSLASAKIGKIHLEEQATITANMILSLLANQPLPEIADRVLHYLQKRVEL